jgi:hypothetical protein
MFEEVVSQNQRLAGFCIEDGDGIVDGFYNSHISKLVNLNWLNVFFIVQIMILVNFT